MTSPVAKITDELAAKAASFVKEHRLPGAAVGVVHGDGLDLVHRHRVRRDFRPRGPATLGE